MQNSCEREGNAAELCGNQKGEADIFRLLERLFGYEAVYDTLRFVSWACPQMQVLLRQQTKKEIIKALERLRQKTEPVLD